MESGISLEALMWFLGEDANYFLSGSNHAGEIRGIASVAQNPGVSAPHVNKAAEAELVGLAGLTNKVFVDSGAFSEVHFPGGVPTVKDEITEPEWNKRLGLYERLGAALGHQLYVVAPDKVAFQADTLERLAKYADRVKALMAKGVNVIVPVQKGELSMATFAQEALRILDCGISDVVWGVPLKKDATNLEELELFTDWLFHSCRPTRVHFLGRGLKSESYVDTLNVVRLGSPWTTVFCDSVRITAMVGRSNGRGGQPRKLTAARDAVLAEGKLTNVTDVKAEALARVLWEELEAARKEMLAAGFDGPEDDFLELESGEMAVAA